MKIYISVDLEGIACVTTTRLEGAEWEAARKWMTAEANAAVEAAFACGADEVVVADSHGHMRNMLPDALHPDALLVRGTPRLLALMEGLDESFDAAFLIGYHARSGAARGAMAHTYSGLLHAVRLNGVTVGESGFNAAIAGHFGVPVALVSGDEVLEAEVGALLPWTERVVCKWAVSTWAAKNLTPQASCRRIGEGARRALGRLGVMQPWRLEAPVRLEVELGPPIFAELGADVPGVERLDGRTLAYTGADMVEVTRILRLILNAGPNTAPV